MPSVEATVHLAAEGPTRASLVETWLTVEAIRGAMVALASTLAPLGVQVVVVKGLFYAFAFGADPARRPMADGDGVVVRGSFDRAVDRLLSTGEWSIECDDWSTKGFRHRPTSGFVDLHRIPLPLGFGRLAGKALRERASRMPRAFGPHLLVPDPLDAASISIANYVKDGCPAGPATTRITGDLALLRASAPVDPSANARRLQRNGLRQIGIVAFTSLAQVGGAWDEWLDALEPTGLERMVAAGVVNGFARLAPNHLDLSLLMARTLADSAPRAAAGFALTAGRLLRDRVRPLLGKRRGRWLRGAL